MITEERLEELIKQGATVWSNSFKEEVNLKDYLGLEKDRDKLILKIREFEGFISYYDVDYLEEDVETAKFKDNYQNITRTETLNLPTWEEFCKEPCFEFTAYNYRYALCIDYDGSLVVGEYDEYENYFPGEEINYGELTKENYLKACELCRKLFLGEEE